MNRDIELVQALTDALEASKSENARLRATLKRLRRYVSTRCIATVVGELAALDREIDELGGREVRTTWTPTK